MGDVTCRTLNALRPSYLIDALLGRTLFEFKSDPLREQRDAESKLPGYLAQRQAETGMHFVGIATPTR